MKITFPKLNYSLLAEITTNIEDYVFMDLSMVTVTNKGANLQYNGTAIPTYYSSLNNGKYDRVVIDFGFLKVCTFWLVYFISYINGLFCLFVGNRLQNGKI